HKQEFYDYLKEHGLILFETIIGSQAYGTATAESDVDKKFVYILPQDYLYGLDYIPQININADYVGYEIKRFLELVKTNNPTILELLNSPEDMIEYKDPIFDLILEKKDKFITKQCKNSFGGYARQQIKKARGQDKMMNWEKDKVTRKNPLDFCYVVDGYDSIPLTEYLSNNSIDQKFCGVAKIANARDMYVLDFDEGNSIIQQARKDLEDKLITQEEYNGILNGWEVFGYKGIVKENADGIMVSNELRLSSLIPDTDRTPFSYNRDGYIAHCRDYKQYKEWLANRNDQRWVDVEGHGQKIDGKNMGHCIRLINMSKEIARGEGIIIKRPEAQYLLDIRHGKVDLDSLIDEANESIRVMDELFDNSDLPDNVDMNLINNLLVS
ncbi:MAG: nucleotidyltransferase domain-containing protein, partial [Chlamydiia bacterium]|nr:nucleotidyltransferase domain-containing protein [Chlamydiia bacterium]